MLKRIIIGFVIVVISPLVWFVQAGRAQTPRRTKRFRFCSELLSLIPFELGMLIRRLYYERTLTGCGENLMVFFGAMFINPDARVGNQVEIRPYCMLGLVDIGDHVSLAQRVSVLSGPHQHRGLANLGEQVRLPPQRVSIGPGAWIGAHAVVMADVGESSVIGAGAVVVHPIPSSSLAVGVPARVVKKIGLESG